MPSGAAPLFTACLAGLAACRSREEVGGEPWEGEVPECEGLEGRMAVPPQAASLTDGSILGKGSRALLDSGAGDDVRIHGAMRPLSENSIAVDPLDPRVVLCANNATTNGVRPRGVQVGWSLDGGQTWSNMILDDAQADPAAAIDGDGAFYVSYLLPGFPATGGIGVRISRDRGATWSARTVTDVDRVDKDHLVADTAAASPFAGRLYASWVKLELPSNRIFVATSSDGGRSWDRGKNVSGVQSMRKHAPNLQTGPGGELYCCWALLHPVTGDENGIGFNSSLDGGDTFLGARVALSNLRGIWSSRIRNTNIQMNSFPSMAVDKSGGARNGWIYVFWTNVGVPGVNVGDADVYMARSRDGGFTWDAPVRVNDDATANAQWQVWGTCDPVNGDLHAVFLDRREDPGDVLARAYVARSRDGGHTWVNLPVGDVTFTPSGLGRSTYMGHYLGIAAQGGRVYPLWSDWRADMLTAYTQLLVFDIEAPVVSCPAALTIEGSAIGGADVSDPAIVAFLSQASAQDELDPAPEIVSDAPAFFPLGTTLVNFTARDDAGHTVQCSAPLTVVDTTAPDFEVRPSLDVLAPADHRLVPIDVTAFVADVVDPDASFALVSIGSSERDSGLGAGDLAKDIQDVELGTPDTRFLLRAENYSRGSGRVYTIKYAARDASGNTRARSLSVNVKP